jgi:hypothetical protein
METVMDYSKLNKEKNDKPDWTARIMLLFIFIAFGSAIAFGYYWLEVWTPNRVQEILHPEPNLPKKGVLVDEKPDESYINDMFQQEVPVYVKSGVEVLIKYSAMIDNVTEDEKLAARAKIREYLSNHTADEIYFERAKMSREIGKQLYELFKGESKERHVSVELNGIFISKQIMELIEARRKAQVKVEMARQDLEMAKRMAEAEKLKAKAIHDAKMLQALRDRERKLFNAETEKMVKDIQEGRRK